MNRHLDNLIDIFDQPKLWIALRSVCDNPQQELRVEMPYVDVGQAQHMDASMLGASAFEPGSLAVTDRMSHFTCRKQKWRFLKAFDKRIVRRDLTPANQFVAYFVRYSLRLLKSAAYSLNPDTEYDIYFTRLLRTIRRMNAVWDALSPGYKFAPIDSLPIDNQMLAFEPRYHVILEAYLACEAI
ncbi:MAG: hypothetical protein IJM59_09925 [Proteobacteria bacterium]|nr:hypothetical protein [Pseudomonadota bacterium]